MTKWVSKLVAALAASAAFAASASAQQGPPPPVCELNPQFKQFDFWVGDWDVYSSDGKMTHFGTNSVTKIATDCLVMEHWQADNGSRGYSMNFYNAVTGKWRQMWVGNGNNIDYSGGLNKDGAMVLTGKIYYYGRGTTFPFRGTWTPSPDGTVLQYFEQYDPAEKLWKPWSKEGLLYVPKAKGELADQIKSLMAAQAKAWNAGDMDAYMAHVWHSPDFRYLADTHMIMGYEAVKNHYAGYDTPEKRGHLSYSDVSVDVIDADNVLVFANWAVKHAERPDADIHGVLTKMFRKIDGNWLTTMVHFSTAPR